MAEETKSKIDVVRIHMREIKDIDNERSSSNTTRDRQSFGRNSSSGNNTKTTTTGRLSGQPKYTPRSESLRLSGSTSSRHENQNRNYPIPPPPQQQQQSAARRLSSDNLSGHTGNTFSNSSMASGGSKKSSDAGAKVPGDPEIKSTSGGAAAPVSRAANLSESSDNSRPASRHTKRPDLCIYRPKPILEKEAKLRANNSQSMTSTSPELVMPQSKSTGDRKGTDYPDRRRPTRERDRPRTPDVRPDNVDKLMSSPRSGVSGSGKAALSPYQLETGAISSPSSSSTLPSNKVAPLTYVGTRSCDQIGASRGRGRPSTGVVTGWTRPVVPDSNYSNLQTSVIQSPINQSLIMPFLTQSYVNQSFGNQLVGNQSFGASSQPAYTTKSSDDQFSGELQSKERAHVPQLMQIVSPVVLAQQPPENIVTTSTALPPSDPVGVSLMSGRGRGRTYGCTTAVVGGGSSSSSSLSTNAKVIETFDEEDKFEIQTIHRARPILDWSKEVESSSETSVDENEENDENAPNVDERRKSEIKIQERKVDDRRQDERKVYDRRQEERRVDERRQGERKSDNRRVTGRNLDERRQEERKVYDRRQEERKVEGRRLNEKKLDEKNVGQGKMVTPAVLSPPRRAPLPPQDTCFAKHLDSKKGGVQADTANETSRIRSPIAVGVSVPHSGVGRASRRSKTTLSRSSSTVSRFSESGDTSLASNNSKKDNGKRKTGRRDRRRRNDSGRNNLASGNECGEMTPKSGDQLQLQAGSIRICGDVKSLHGEEHDDQSRVKKSETKNKRKNKKSGRDAGILVTAARPGSGNARESGNYAGNRALDSGVDAKSVGSSVANPGTPAAKSIGLSAATSEISTDKSTERIGTAESDSKSGRLGVGFARPVAESPKTIAGGVKPGAGRANRNSEGSITSDVHDQMASSLGNLSLEGEHEPPRLTAATSSTKAGLIPMSRLQDAATARSGQSYQSADQTATPALQERPLCVVPPSMEERSPVSDLHHLSDPTSKRYYHQSNVASVGHFQDSGFSDSGGSGGNGGMAAYNQPRMSTGQLYREDLNDSGSIRGYEMPSAGVDSYYRYYPEVDATGGPRVVSGNEIQNPRDIYKMSATEKNIREAVELEAELNSFLNQPYCSSNLQKLDQCRWKIQLRYENTILSNLEFSTKHNIEQVLWKSAFYQVIECFRCQMADNPSIRDEVRQALIRLIDAGTMFYENLLERLQERFEFSLNEFFDSNAVRDLSLSKSVKLALVSAQKTTICLGDLARYREQACDSAQFGKARSWYLKAQQLAPKNGRPYNQLAILAVYARRKLDAVYYYMRSLAASNPFQTAKEGLISIFDDARRKYELNEKDQQSSRPAPTQSWRRGPTASYRQIRGHSRGAQSRPSTDVELWFTADGRAVQQGSSSEAFEDADSEEEERRECEEDLRQLTAVELSKRFSLSFLHVHGKLYSRIGMETFGEACIKMLREFRALLRAKPVCFEEKRLLQLVTINMFAIANAGMKGPEAMVAPHCQSVVQGRALEMGVEIFRLLVERTIELLHKSTVFGDELQQLLPSLKIWCDWFMCCTSVWHPLPQLTDLGSRSENQDVWSQLCTLLNIFGKMDLTAVHTNGTEGCDAVVLPEDLTLAGFVPLLALVQETLYSSPHVDKEMARNIARAQRIQYCGLYLSGIHPPVLNWDVERKEYVSVAARRSSTSSEDLRPGGTDPFSSDSERHDASLLDNGSVSGEGWDAEDGGWADDPTGQHLRRRKYELERIKADHEQQRRQIQAVLHEVAQPLKIRFEVRPKWLVPDTNCFIDHLHHLRTLVANKKYNLVVPLIVISELDGLSRGLRGHAAPRLLDQGTQAHALKVSAEAKEALEYLDSCFLSRLSNVKAITAMGSIMDTIAFRSEDTFDKEACNDDIILSCCVKLGEEASSSPVKHYVRKEKGEMKHVVKDVVLLTDDRNLRVKAHAHEMPVKDIPRFMELMNL